MNKLIPITEETCEMLLKLIGFDGVNYRSTALPDGDYAITDESGLGIKGLATVNDGKILAKYIGVAESLDALNSDKEFTLSEMHRELQAKVEGIPFEFAVFFDGLEMVFICGGFRLIYRKKIWDVPMDQTNEWKSMLVEHNTTEAELLGTLQQLDRLNFDCRIFYYSPSKGLYLP